MNIGFTAVHFSERGTTTALYDYAYFNEKLLGNRSIIFYQKNHPENFPEYEKKLNKEFKCYAYNDFSEVDDIIKKENIDAFYSIKYGSRDNIIVTSCPNLIHSVYVNDPHGEKYAFVSRWLSEKYGNKIPYIPHMINLPKHNENLRKEHNIPEDAIVFGGYGGKNAFNIGFVHETINKVVEINPNIYFFFMNFDRNTKPHPRIIYLPPTIDRHYKVKFINTCDAMIHAQILGETFGLAIGEFSICNKPVITYLDNSPMDPTYPYANKEHLRILGNKALLYTDGQSLYNILINFRKEPNKDWNRYQDYTPEKVMEIFESVFLNIVTSTINKTKWTLFKYDAISEGLLNGKLWEPHVTEAFKVLVNKGNTVIDIGANFGYHTKTLSKLVEEDGKVYAFEPQRLINHLLIRNIKNNNMKNIFPLKIALSNNDTTVSFSKVNWLAQGQNMGDSYINTTHNINNTICMKLDNFYFDKVDLIKMDIQGCEVLCLEGMQRLLDIHKPYLIIEAEEICLNRFGATCKQLFDYLRKLEYSIFYMEYEYPSDHLCVHNSKLEQFNKNYGKYISTHKANNYINNNLSYGINLKIKFN
jgi:FkbM family methyltransferase